MKKVMSLMFISALSLAVLLAGCGSREQAEDDTERGSVAPSETITSSGTESFSEPETYESEIASEDPDSSMASVQTTESEFNEEENSRMQMNVQVGGSTFTATLEENTAVDALVEMMEQGSVTIEMSDYSGFEKVGPLGTSLPTSNQQTTTHAGDIVLYQGNQIVMFYGSNSWSYTRLGHIDDLTGWEEALGSGDVTVTFSLEG